MANLQARDVLMKRLNWRSRRGMLELDLALAPLREQLDKLSGADIAAAQSLLASEDTYLWDIIVTGSGKPLPEHSQLLAKLGIGSSLEGLAS